MVESPAIMPMCAPSDIARRAVAAGCPIRVLLVEDDAQMAELVQMSLLEDAHDRFQVEWAHNLAEAMIQLSQAHTDVVLLDLGLPELSGYKSYRAIESAAGRKLPVVILTADDRSVSRDLTVGLGAAGYLLKHETSPAQLKQALRNAVLPPA
jgi:DNA-binding response OmpR family regulator